MGEVGYGLLTTATAVGGIVGVSSYTWLERHIPLATLMRTCLLLEVLTHLSLALSTQGWEAIVVMLVFGSYAYVWLTVSQTVRQRAVPTEFQGRVSSVYMVGLFGGLLIGQALGGWIAEVWGLTAPFWFAFVGSGLTLALVWRQLAHIAHAGEVPAGRNEHYSLRAVSGPVIRSMMGSVEAMTPSEASDADDHQRVVGASRCLKGVPELRADEQPGGQETSRDRNCGGGEERHRALEDHDLAQHGKRHPAEP